MNGQLATVARAEELSRSQRWPEAADGWQAVVGLNPVNGVYWNRLGQARFALGDYRSALTAYEKATALGVWPVRGPEPVPLADVFPGEICYRIACCHARLGNTAPALDALAGAVRYNLRDLDRATTDEHLASLRDDPRFRELVGPPDTGARSRVDGWRADLRTLCREVRRRVPFRDVVDAGFDRAAADLERAIPDLPDIQVTIGMWRLLRRLNDGHSRILAHPAFPDWGRCLPVWFFLFAEGLFVTAADPRYERLVGAQVLAFDGWAVPEVVAALDPLLTRDNEYGPAGSAAVWLRQPAYLHALGAADRPGGVTLSVRLAGGDTADIAVEAEAAQPPRSWPRGGAPQVRPLGAGPQIQPRGEAPQVQPRGGTPRFQPSGEAPRPAAPVPAYLRAADTPYWFEYLPAANLVYFQFNAIQERPDEPLAEFSDRLFAAVDDHHAAALAIDLRWNGGGNTFLAMPLVDRVIRHDRVNRRGALFVIIGRDTFSAAQNTATLLDRHTHALFVGEPSGSSPNFVGETAPFTLPHSGLRVNVSDLYWQTSWPLDHRTAIAPDIYAPPTFAAFRDGRDPAMEAILDTLADGACDGSPDGAARADSRAGRGNPSGDGSPDGAGGGINRPEGAFEPA
ncbi:TPR end-of-group domain-containing protein [Rugosimonospora africana]|uniref:Tetratricopeptide repeat-containing protein n=1 Tax=Rugosimonospora africana TaxID=556532 RepID=A0A8J3VVP1_9ACTN|nr:tetratricopeptide repeat protein [Rugosimonospora africana]GIH20124.1 hypothetical protein Raf01_82960 [Rugosimonospora africana]